MSEEITFEDELRRYWSAKPFMPFDIVLSSGDRYEVTSQEQVAFAGDTVVVVMPRTGIRLLRRQQIVAFHVHEPAN